MIQKLGNIMTPREVIADTLIGTEDLDDYVVADLIIKALDFYGYAIVPKPQSRLPLDIGNP